MQGPRWWLVCYDVREPKRLRRCARRMEGAGERIQYSVFRCWMTERAMEKLRWELTSMLQAEDDVLFIPLCSRCIQGLKITHAAVKKPDWPDEPSSHRIV